MVKRKLTKLTLFSGEDKSRIVVNRTGQVITSRTDSTTYTSRATEETPPTSINEIKPNPAIEPPESPKTQLFFPPDRKETAVRAKTKPIRRKNCTKNSQRSDL